VGICGKEGKRAVPISGGKGSSFDSGLKYTHREKKGIRAYGRKKKPLAKERYPEKSLYSEDVKPSYVRRYV